MSVNMKVYIEWPSVTYCITSGMIQIARFQRGPDSARKVTIIEITPEEIERVINDLEVAAIMATEAHDEVT